MELRVLKYFLMVAREENITKAAQLLHLTQPTLSRQLMQLEEELGAKLFERGKHNIVLTEAGMLLKRRAQEISDLADKTLEEFSQKEENLSGEIRIGSGDYLAMDYISELLSAFRQQHPLITYKLMSGNTDNIKDWIERGILDIGLLQEPVDMSKYEYIKLPGHEKMGIYIHEDHPLAKQEYVQADDLKGISLMAPGRQSLQQEIENWFGSSYDKLDIFVHHNLLYNAAIMAQHKMGAVIAIKLNSHFEGLKFIPFYPKLEMSLALAWKKNQFFSPATTAFINFMKDYMKNLEGQEK